LHAASFPDAYTASGERLLFEAVAALSLVGCSSDSDRCRVQGDVSYNGEPVDDGGIALVPEQEGESQVRATGEIVDGHYALDSKRGPYPGNYRVVIYWNKKTGRMITSKASGATKEERKQVIPAKYNERTELKVEVKPGRNTHDFHLQNRDLPAPGKRKGGTH
jgi:hypothetical protein